MSDTRQLFSLQQLDTSLDAARARLAEIERILNDNSAVKKAKKQAAQAEEKRVKAQLALKRAEQEVQAQQDKIDKNQKMLYGGSVKAPKELEDLQMEPGALRRYLELLEDRQLEAMIAFEEAESTESSNQTNLEKVQREVADQNQDLTKEQGKLTKEADKLEAERQSLASNIPPDMISQYEKLRKKRAGLAVVEVKQSSCSACGSTLTAAQAQAARSPSQTTKCEMCGRILYSK